MMSEAIFSVLVAELLRARHRERRKLRAAVAGSIGHAPNPSARLGEFLDAATGEDGGMDGLDIAIDVVSLLPGTLAWSYAVEFWSRDAARLDAASARAHTDHDPRDDAWYALIRGIAANPGLDVGRKILVAEWLIERGTESMREAAAHALGALGGERARAKLRRLARDRSGLVRESAREILGDFDAIDG